jgi:DNA gyrase subunit A
LSENGSDEPEGPARMAHAGPAISVEDEMRRSYLDYAMSVVVSRAIPDLRDGLKPVHRRILFSMHENGFTHDKPYRKSARVVGDVIGKYHPHGDQSVYDALVRMAQDFSMRLPLLDGQGNFGSLDADPPAAMRYTEVRMARPASFLLGDLDMETVDFQPNYDGQDREPTVLPARFPNLLVNGAGGIAVGMATNIPPHNLGEVVDGCLALIANPDLTVAELMEKIPGPDFPTGGLILGRSGARAAYHLGRGSVVVRAKTKIEELRKDRFAIVVEEVPYQVNKATMVEKIAELAREKKIEGIAHVQDESDRFGVRVVIELKRDATPDVVLNQLWRFTPMQTTFGCNMLALNGGRPEQMDLRTILSAFLSFREEVIARRTAFELRKARERAHVLCGLAVAVENVDEVVATIRASADAGAAREALMARRWPAAAIADYIRLIDDPSHRMNDDGTYNLSETQARAILDLRLQRLTQLGVKEVTDELEALAAKITDFLDILRSRPRILAIVAAELTEIRDAFATPRRTQFLEHEGDVDDEDLIEREEMVVTVTHGGYVKRTPLADYRAQARGGKGLAGMATKDEDFVTTLFVANTHTPILVFTTDGIVYKLKCWRLPLGARNARGRPVVNVLPVGAGVSIAAMMPVDAPEADWEKLQIVFATSEGDVRRNALSDFTNVMRNGKIAMKLPDGVRLVGARICDDGRDLMLFSALGKAIRFHIGDRDADGAYKFRVFAGRESTGVRGLRLGAGDEVVSMAVIGHFEATPEERDAYLRMRRAVAGGGPAEDEDAAAAEESEGEVAEIPLSQERYAEMSAAEEMILTITSKGLGKRTSSHEYRITARGGQGIIAADLSPRKNDPDRSPARVVAAWPVGEDDQIMLVTDAGQSIRCPVSDVSAMSRGARGVRVLNTADGERVVSVALVAEEGEPG